MELKQIQYFLRIVDQGGLSRAADSLYLTQPALSRFLAKLEESTGVQLFHRRRDSSLELTEAGKIYLQASRKIDAIWRDMEADLNALTENQYIRLGFDDDFLYKRIQKAAVTIGERFPNVSLESRHFNSEEIQSAILEGTIDIGMTSFYDFNEQLTYMHLEENEVDLVVGKAHPLSKLSYQKAGQEQLRLSLTELPPDTPFLLTLCPR